jgi:hypothetical protein
LTRDQAGAFYIYFSVQLLVNYVVASPARKEVLRESLLNYLKDPPTELGPRAGIEGMIIQSMLDELGLNGFTPTLDDFIGSVLHAPSGPGSRSAQPVWDPVTGTLGFLGGSSDPLLRALDAAAMHRPAPGGGTDVSPANVLEDAWDWITSAIADVIDWTTTPRAEAAEGAAAAAGAAVAAATGGNVVIGAAAGVAVGAIVYFAYPAIVAKTKKGKGTQIPGEDGVPQSDPDQINMRMVAGTLTSPSQMLADWQKLGGLDELDLPQATKRMLELRRVLDTARQTVGWQMGVNDKTWRDFDRGLGTEGQTTGYLSDIQKWMLRNMQYITVNDPGQPGDQVDELGKEPSIPPRAMRVNALTAVAGPGLQSFRVTTQITTVA